MADFAGPAGREVPANGPEPAQDASAPFGAHRTDPQTPSEALSGTADLDDATLAGLARVLAAINGLPSKVEARPTVPTRWRDVPVGATVLYGIPRKVLVNDPRQTRRTVVLDNLPAIYPLASEHVQLVEEPTDDRR